MKGKQVTLYKIGEDPEDYSWVNIMPVYPDVEHPKEYRVVGPDYPEKNWPSFSEAVEDACLAGYDSNERELNYRLRYETKKGLLMYVRDLENRLNSAMHDFGMIESAWFHDEIQVVQHSLPDVTVYAAIYDRAYGGPEEGGWWYDTYTVLQDFKPREMRMDRAKAWCCRANQLARQLINRNRRSPSSVLSEGHIVFKTTMLPEPVDEPRERPHYE